MGRSCSDAWNALVSFRLRALGADFLVVAAFLARIGPVWLEGVFFLEALPAVFLLVFWLEWVAEGALAASAR